MRATKSDIALRVGSGASRCGEWRAPGSNATQTESLTVNAGQVAYKHGGIGQAGGAQAGIVGQRQLVATPGGVSSQGQVIVVGQRSSVSGAPGSHAVAGQALTVTGSQASN